MWISAWVSRNQWTRGDLTDGQWTLPSGGVFLVFILNPQFPVLLSLPLWEENKESKLKEEMERSGRSKRRSRRKGKRHAGYNTRKNFHFLSRSPPRKSTPGIFSYPSPPPALSRLHVPRFLFGHTQIMSVSFSAHRTTPYYWSWICEKQNKKIRGFSFCAHFINFLQRRTKSELGLWNRYGHR